MNLRLFRNSLFSYIGIVYPPWIYVFICRFVFVGIAPWRNRAGKVRSLRAVALREQHTNEFVEDAIPEFIYLINDVYIYISYQ